MGAEGAVLMAALCHWMDCNITRTFNNPNDALKNWAHPVSVSTQTVSSNLETYTCTLKLQCCPTFFL